MTRPTSQIKEIILINKRAGFDELALICGVDKWRVKEMWNELELGFKFIPRTLISIRSHIDRDYELMQDVLIYIDPFTPVVIPKGYITDLGSVPSLFRWFVDKDDKHFLVAFLLHDLQYDTQWVSRGVADQNLLMNAQRLGASLFRRYVVYYGVRLGGWVAWIKNKGQDKQKLFHMIDLATNEYIKNQEKQIFKI